LRQAPDSGQARQAGPSLRPEQDLPSQEALTPRMNATPSPLVPRCGTPQRQCRNQIVVIAGSRSSLTKVPRLRGRGKGRGGLPSRVNLFPRRPGFRRGLLAWRNGRGHGLREMAGLPSTHVRAQLCPCQR
jgi:hypothetical protein